MGKKKKLISVTNNEKYVYTMKMVTSNTCVNCKKKCPRGLAYLDKMSKPGAIGKGIPCILTKGKAFL